MSDRARVMDVIDAALEAAEDGQVTAAELAHVLDVAARVYLGVQPWELLVGVISALGRELSEALTSDRPERLRRRALRLQARAERLLARAGALDG